MASLSYIGILHDEILPGLPILPTSQGLPWQEAFAEQEGWSDCARLT